MLSTSAYRDCLTNIFGFEIGQHSIFLGQKILVHISLVPFFWSKIYCTCKTNGVVEQIKNLFAIKVLNFTGINQTKSIILTVFNRAKTELGW